MVDESSAHNFFYQLQTTVNEKVNARVNKSGLAVHFVRGILTFWAK